MFSTFFSSARDYIDPVLGTSHYSTAKKILDTMILRMEKTLKEKSEYYNLLLNSNVSFYVINYSQCRNALALAIKDILKNNYTLYQALDLDSKNAIRNNVVECLLIKMDAIAETELSIKTVTNFSGTQIHCHLPKTFEESLEVKKIIVKTLQEDLNTRVSIPLNRQVI